MAANECLSRKCAARYEMTQLEFRRLRGELLWDASFISRLGKLATRLYKEVYGKQPKRRLTSARKRDHVHRYPCGFLEQAYAQLKAQGVTLVQPHSELEKRLRRHGQISPKPPWDRLGPGENDPSGRTQKFAADRMSG
jgi:hypothetical protein